MPLQDEILDAETVAEVLGHRPWYVAQLVKQKQIRHMRVGRRLLFRRADVDAFLLARTVEVEEGG